MEPSETFSTEPCLENLLSSRISQGSSLDGNNPSSSEDMLTETNTEPLILLSTNLELSKSPLRAMMVLNKKWKFTNSQDKEELEWECTTPIKVSTDLLTAASNMPFRETILSI